MINFKVDVFHINFQVNFYLFGNKPDTTGFKISSESFELLKILSKMIPNSQEVLNEKLICIDAYSHQHQMNIYKSLVNQIQLIHVLLRNKGISRVYVHDQRDGKIKFDDTNTINGSCWFAPWALESLMKFSYFELDCTFSILNPYIACIPQLIIKNVSLPIGFICGVEESSELYRLLYN